MMILLQVLTGRDVLMGRSDARGRESEVFLPTG